MAKHCGVESKLTDKAPQRLENIKLCYILAVYDVSLLDKFQWGSFLSRSWY